MKGTMFIIQQVWIDVEATAERTTSVKVREHVAAYVDQSEVRWSDDRADAMLWDCREAAEEAAAALRKAGQSHVTVASRCVSVTPFQSYLELERRGLA